MLGFGDTCLFGGRVLKVSCFLGFRPRGVGVGVFGELFAFGDTSLFGERGWVVVFFMLPAPPASFC